MNKEWEKVREFQSKAKQPVSDVPLKLSNDRVRIRELWMSEELSEFKNASDIVEQADAIIDLLYFALGTLVEMGIKPDDLFDIVHKANMSKLNTEEGFHYDKNGKVLKPHNWESPNNKIKSAIELDKE